MARARTESFSLTADMMYVSANAPRICRALFEICLRRSWSTAADLALTMCKVRPFSWCPQTSGTEQLSGAGQRGRSFVRDLHFCKQTWSLNCSF